MKPPSKQESQDLKASNVVNSHVWAYSVDEIEAAVWQRDLVNGLADAWIAVTLPLLTQLRQLHLSYDRNTPHLGRVIQRVINDEHPFHGQHTFQHLQKVSLDLSHDMDEHAYSNTEYGLLFSSSDIVMPVFQLPSLREFFATGLVDPTSPKMESNNSNNTAFSSITAIDLRESCGNYGMEKLISSCVALKSFKYQHSDSRLQSLGYRPAEFYRALIRSKKTLEVLWLDNHGIHHPFTAAGLNQTHEQFFGSLAEFSVLRELRIRLTNLLDIEFQNEPTTPLLDCLPSSLNSLFIEGCKMRHISTLAAQIGAVIKSRHTRFPNLQRIEIEGNFHDRSCSYIEETNDCMPENTSEVPLVALPLYLDCITAGFDLKFRKFPFS
ncbi:hypothetical protein N7490_008022 [Penicillium lividum]|nr:hypothetical protein N7490_008022 [Penicillium lividum]